VGGEGAVSILATFTYGEKPVRVVQLEGEPWFVAADVCAVLEIGNPTMALRSLDDDERALNSIEGIPGGVSVNVISWPGLYSLVLRSRKPEAKKFDRWLRHEVLEQIRKTGSYSIEPPAPAPLAPAMALDPILSMLAVMREDQLKLNQRLAALETCAAADKGLVKQWLVRDDSKLKELRLDVESLSVSEAAKALCGTWETVVALCESGDLQWYRKGPKRRIVTASLLRYQRSPKALEPVATRTDDDGWDAFYQRWAAEFGLHQPVQIKELMRFAEREGLLYFVLRNPRSQHGRLSAMGRAIAARVDVARNGLIIRIASRANTGTWYRIVPEN
jgi:prophage antirepressor-like protein